MTTEQQQKWLHEAVKEIRNLLAVEVDESNGDEMAAHLMKLSSMQATASMAQATAEKLLLNRQNVLIAQLPDLSPNLKLAWLKAESADERGMLTYCERLSASLSHSIEAMRTGISRLKKEFENSKYQT